MGGFTALNYLVYGKRTAIGCALNCPVTDLKAIFSDRRDFRRAILSAHITEEASLDEIIERYSPVCFAKDLPRIPYFLVFGESDRYFVDTQMPGIVEKFNKYGLEYTLMTVPKMKHCDLDGHEDARLAFCDFLASLPSDK